MTKARDLSNIISGGFTADDIPSLDTAKITSGTFAAARIDNTSLSNVTALPFSAGTDWQSTIVTGSTLTAVVGKGYWIDTTSNTCTITLPASASVGDFIEFSDYARTWGTNAITINQNSLNFQGYTSPNPEYNTSGQSVKLIYSGATQGWIPTVDDDVTYETEPLITTNFLVLAGGGSGGEDLSGGGGAGGLRSSYGSTGGGGSPETALGLTEGETYTITVGAGYPASDNNPGSGSNSSISGTGITTITAIGGGEAGGEVPYGSTSNSGQDGGCGGGGRTSLGLGGAGTSGQGFAGGTGGTGSGGGGGGTGAVGVTSSTNVGGNGGAGVSNSITGSAVNYGGGGGGSASNGNTIGSGGSGGGGNGSNTQGAAGQDGSANLGGGGGGGGNSICSDIAAGGSGVVILRLATADYTSTTTGSPTVTTDGTDTILKFTGNGSYTA